MILSSFIGRSTALAALMLILPLHLEAATSDARAARAFEQLSSLVGEWQGTFADGRAHSVTYRLTAGGAVLVETWALGPGRESMTLYHRDGGALLADHYCPQGNTPRLELSPESTKDKLSFVFRDGANLKVPGKAHQHAFWIALDGANSYRRSETYLENGSAGEDAVPDAPIAYSRAVPEGR